VIKIIYYKMKKLLVLIKYLLLNGASFYAVSLQASIVTAVAIGKRDFSVEPPGMGLRRATEVIMQSGNGTPIGFKPKNECKKAG